jgi:uncharacterized lipoprotein
MNRLFTLIIAFAAAALLGACDSHSWDKETSRLFHKKGHAHGKDSHAAPHGEHAPAGKDAHAAPEVKKDSH